MKQIPEKNFEQTFLNLLKNNNFKRYSRKLALGVLTAERSNRTIRDLLEKPVLQWVYTNWLDVLATTTKQYNNRIQSPTELTPIQASLKKKEGFVFLNSVHKRK